MQKKITPIFILISVAFLVSVDITIMIFAEALCFCRVKILFSSLLKGKVHNVKISLVPKGANGRKITL